ncbi:zinc finger CCCH domain-containing protein 20-like [Andrographis paniculata]|uniref:zinc finger CCCH domain-containing protein 20-like n=1 Tax=Andrographis paniculata TaxID=175694 RepID=UPI0021E6E89B|nr:zinc finger CCCH domain-containing protein 20-like [Andrographis paniculata]
MMMMIGGGDHPRSNPTVQIPPWDCRHVDDSSMAHIYSPAAADGGHYEDAFAALQRYLPSNKDDDSDDFDVPVDAFSCDDFRMFEFKVKKCARARSHDWTQCPFAHPGEKARRRDPRKYHYSGRPCPDFRKGACKRGDACEYAHGVFECWLHPARYRTQPCKDGTHCRRRVCFFAHTPEQLRVLPYTGSPDDSFMLIASSPNSSFYSPPSSPVTGSPPVSPGGSLKLSQLTESIRDMQLNKSGMGQGLGPGSSLSPTTSWGFRFGSPRSPSTVRPGFASLPTTPIRAVTRSGLNPFDAWETSCAEEPVMERVESGKALRERLYAKLGKENSLDRVGQAESASSDPDIGWVSELVK